MPDPVPWTIQANGEKDIGESYGFRTDVMEAFNGAEQRMRLRSVPLERNEFEILAIGREAQLADKLIYSQHDQIMAVPLWQYGSKLTADVNINDSLLEIADAQDVPYRRSVDNGGYALVWQGPFTWELFAVSSTSASGVHTSDTAAAFWAKDATYVFPAREARLTERLSVNWLTSNVLEARLAFTGEPI